MQETRIVYTPLGIRFWDNVADQPIRDGLQVVAAPQAAPERPTEAFRTGNGIYAFDNLPGLRAVTHPHDRTVSLDAVEPRRFVITVTDTQRRFMPMRFGVMLPITGYRGVYQPNATVSPPDGGESRYYLFSAPGRVATFGIAAIRTQLVEADTQPARPAAFAYVEIEIDGERHIGYADRRGCVAILLPYPSFTTGVIDGGSPPGPAIPLPSQQWLVTVRVRYRSKSDMELADLWEFVDIRDQPPANLHSHMDTPAQSTLHDILHYGQELILRTDRPGPSPASTLWVRPNV